MAKLSNECPKNRRKDTLLYPAKETFNSWPFKCKVTHPIRTVFSRVLILVLPSFIQCYFLKVTRDKNVKTSWFWLWGVTRCSQKIWIVTASLHSPMTCLCHKHLCFVDGQGGPIQLWIAFLLLTTVRLSECWEASLWMGVKDGTYKLRSKQFLRKLFSCDQRCQSLDIWSSFICFVQVEVYVNVREEKLQIDFCTR